MIGPTNNYKSRETCDNSDIILKLDYKSNSLFI